MNRISQLDRSQFGPSQFGPSQFGQSQFGRSQFGRSQFGRSQLHRYRSGRRGVLTVCVIVCMGIAVAIMAVTVHAALRARRNVQLEHQLVQTEWLLDAGVNRAVTQMNQQSDYDGETWTPSGPLEALGTATVAITVSAGSTNSQTIDVTATIVESSKRSRTTRRSYRFTRPINPSESFNAESSDE